MRFFENIITCDSFCECIYWIVCCIQMSTHTYTHAHKQTLACEINRNEVFCLMDMVCHERCPWSGVYKIIHYFSLCMRWQQQLVYWLLRLQERDLQPISAHIIRMCVLIECEKTSFCSLCIQLLIIIITLYLTKMCPEELLRYET